MDERVKWGRAVGLIRAVLVGGMLAAGGVGAAEPVGPLLLGAERGVDADLPGVDFRARYAGAALGAGAGGQSLAVWVENRDGSFAQARDAYDLYGTRLAADGTPLDAEPLVISRAVGNQTAPVIAFDGTQYLVVWQDTRCEGQTDLYGARVKADGTVLDADGFLIATAVGEQEAPRVAFHDGLFLVVWTDRRTAYEDPSKDSDIYGARVRPDGTSMDVAGFPIASTRGNEQGAAVAPGPTSFLVTWSAPQGVLAAHVDASGRRVEAVPAFLSPVGRGTTSLAFDGTRYLVAWVEEKPDSVCLANFHGVIFRCDRIKGALLASDGTVVRDSLNLSTAPDYSTHVEPQLAAIIDDTGTSRFLVTWKLGGGRTAPFRVEANWVDADGTASPVQVLRGDGAEARVAAVGDRVGAVWTGSGVFATWLTHGSAPLTPVNIRGRPRLANEQSFPAVASSGTHALAVWLDNRNGRNDLYGLRLGPDGVPVSGPAVHIASATEATGNFHRPSVAFGGGVYLVTWGDDRGNRVWGARLAEDGTLLDATPLRLAEGAEATLGEPSVASEGTGFFVVWAGWDDFGRRSVFGVRLTAQGTVSGSRVQVSRQRGWEDHPAVSFDGTQYVVAWRYQDPYQDNVHPFAARVSREGQVLDPNGIQLGTTEGVSEHPILASDGTNSLVVWRTDAGSGGAFIEGARLSPSGVLLDPTPLLLSSTRSYNLYNLTPPALTFDGTDYVVAWLNDVYPQGTRPWTAAPLAYRVHGARVRTDGTSRDPGSLVLGGGNEQPRVPTLTRVGQGTSLLLYHQYEATPAVHALRLRARTLGSGTCSAEPCVSAPRSACSATDFCSQPAPAGSCPPGTPPEPGPTPKEETVTPPGDGGVPSDGGVPDAGSPGGADGGTSPEPEPEPGGWGCSAAGGPEGAVLLLLGALVAVGRRRRAA